MTSKALEKFLLSRQELFGPLMDAHAAYLSGTWGIEDPVKSKSPKGNFLMRNGVVVLMGAFQSYVEDLCDEAFTHRFPSADSELKSMAIGRVIDSNSGAGTQHINKLFKGVGLDVVMNDVAIRNRLAKTGAKKGKAYKRKPVSIDDRLKEMCDKRNDIAHGGQPNITRTDLRRDIRFITAIAKKLDELLARKIQEKMGLDALPW